MPEKVLKETEKQLKRLEKMHPDTAESATVRTYLEWMVELPWSKKSKDNLDLKAANKVLNEDHYDLEKVKERILEYLAVRKAQRENERARFSVSSARPASAKHRSASLSPVRSDASSSASVWAACEMKQKSAAIAAPTSARSPAA